MKHRMPVRQIMSVVLAVLGMLIPGAGAVTAQDCEIPLFVKQGLTGANVMILADNSGSMNEAILHADYDPETAYTGNFNRAATYYITKTKAYEPNDFYSYWPATPSATLISSDNGQDGRYPGNYLNWIYFHATAAQRAAVPQVSRIQVLKSILNEIITRSQRLNFGLTVFQYDHGGSIIGKCGVNETSLHAQIDGITANTWTPLGESMETLVDYFSNDGPDAVIQSPCQYNFLLVVTDGYPTMDLDVSPYLWDADHDGRDPGNCASIGAPYDEWNNCSDHFDDVAYYMQHTDLRPDLDGDQTVVTYVVGYGLDAPLLEDAAINGDGLYFYAENAIQLYLSMERAIQDILRRISAGSAVAVVSTERGVDDRLYRGKFMPLDWDGYLECYSLPYQSGDTALWEAGEILRSRNPSDRTIFTALGDTRYDFVPLNANNLYTAMNVGNAAVAESLIYWARGSEYEGWRDRNGWKLGDIVHATPVVVGKPATFIMEESYQNFYQANLERQKMVYVGANDGMLHAFNAENGQEEWAFVPEFALPDFATMADTTYCHVYTCDQTATVKDVMIGGLWRTILISGGREGGASLFALDITEPLSPDVLWQVDLPNGKSYSSEVEIVSIGGNPVALVGSGLDQTDFEAWIYGYDVATGALLGSRELSTTAGPRNKASRPAVVDLDLDGNVDLIYVADLGGSLWRMEVAGYTNPASWSVSELYTGGLEITSPPVAAYAPDGGVNVYFGTGAYLTDDDMTTTDQQRFICVFDRHAGSTFDYRDLADQSSAIGELTDENGWYVELWNELGERVTEAAVVVAETVIFTTFAPTLDACVGGGNSYLYQMAYDTGGLAQEAEGDQPEDRSVSLGDGVASYPVVDLAAGTVVIQSSDAEIHVQDIAAPITPLTVRSWQENYDDLVLPPQETVIQ